MCGVAIVHLFSAGVLQTLLNPRDFAGIEGLTVTAVPHPDH
jgi:hypothetical protein